MYISDNKPLNGDPSFTIFSSLVANFRFFIKSGINSIVIKTEVSL